MMAFISCVLCWIIGVVMGSDHRVITRLADEVLRLRAEDKAQENRKEST